MNMLAHQNALLLAQQKINEYERLLAEKNSYLAKLELDLEHAVNQCKQIAAQGLWINRRKPGLEQNHK
jgi:hypothetical protein